MAINSYSAAGVDIEKGDRFAQFISKIKSTAVSSSIGGFAGGIEIDTEKYKRPVLLSTTDGVGTKLLVARKLGIYDTIGIDLVAMCVNDLIVCGAAPLVFLDYIACGRLDEEMMKDVIKGVVNGCEQSGCTLSGGETAEMPDLYSEGDFDLAGFSVGIAEKSKILPKMDKINSGDIIYGMASSGVHSNGFSLARKVIPETDTKAMKALLVPTTIYVNQFAALLESGIITAAAHITGGGLEGNIKRVLPPELVPDFSHDWKVPEIFNMIRARGNIDEAEMRRVFNMGIGLAFIVPGEKKDLILAHAENNGIDIEQIGTLKNG